MLKLRICPKCGMEARSPYSYFCHSCGVDLPSPEEVKEEPKDKIQPEGKRRIPLSIIKVKIIKFKKPFIFFALSVLFILLLILSLSLQRKIKRTSDFDTLSVESNQWVLKTVRYNIPIMLFGEADFVSLVPSDVDFYLESSTLDILIGQNLKEEEKQELEEILGLTLSEAASFLSSSYVIIERGNKDTNIKEVAFVSKVKALDFVKAKLAEVNELFSFKARLLGDNFIIYNSDEFYEDIESAFKKQRLNLNLSSEFIEIKKSLPVQGQIFIYHPERSYQPAINLIPKNIPGVGFVISATDEGSLIQGPLDE